MDNPCWGGPEIEKHSLEHLLHQIDSGEFATTTTTETTTSSSSIILHHDDSYLVLNKPPDLRMDGPHPATVHKLLTFWFPPPSLQQHQQTQQQQKTTLTNDDSCDNKIIHHQRRQFLLSAVALLSKHNDLKDNILRPTHQLDYATSGVLLIGKTKNTAGLACKAFQERKVRKQYLAIVHGHMNIGSSSSSNEEDLSPWYNSSCSILKRDSKAWKEWIDGTFELQHRKQRSKIGVSQTTFRGYMPAHAIFGKWKGIRSRIGKKRKKRRLEADSKDDQLKSSLDQILLESDLTLVSKEKEEHLLNCNWREVKNDSGCKSFFERMTKKYNDHLERSIVKRDIANANNIDDTSSIKLNLPTIFRIEGDSPSTMYIHTPLAEVPNEFRVVVDRETVIKGSGGGISKEILNHYSASCHDSDLQFKPSLTRCVVLEKGLWKDAKENKYPISKVLLQPLTGRRHQLRVHLAICEHAILGDATYECKSSSLFSAICDDKQSPTVITKERISCRRMCLHAHSLALPLLQGERTFMAPDPFEWETNNGSKSLNILKI